MVTRRYLWALSKKSKRRRDSEVRSAQAQADHWGITWDWRSELEYCILQSLRFVSLDHAVNALTYSSASVLD
jgi:hypothetical protein